MLYQGFTKAARISSFVATFFALIFMPCAGSISAQVTRTMFDGRTPTGVEPGSASNLEDINLFNGNLNFALPALHIGGRGAAGYTMMLRPTLQRHYVERIYTDYSFGTYIDRAQENINPRHSSGYGPGLLIGKPAHTGYTNITSCEVGVSTWQELSRLIFIAPDGSEYQLHDTAYNGAPLTYTCGNQHANRGRVFVTADGGSMTFVSDNNIIDSNNLGLTSFSVTGNLMFKDGAVYRVEDSLVKWIRDRNGNKISFTYRPHNIFAYTILSAITDSLNRVINILYGSETGAAYDTISFKGFGGADRAIQVWYSNPNSVLRQGSSTQTFGQLYPQLYTFSLGDYDNRNYIPGSIPVISRIVLPDEREYKFYYNSYGELARVILPIGGGYDYEYTSPVVDGLMLYRRLSQRTEYANLTPTTDPNNPPQGDIAGKVFYSATLVDAGNGLINTIVTVDYKDSGNNLQARDKHYFFGWATEESSECNTVLYSPWYSGREFKTESYGVSNGVAGAALKRTEDTWSPGLPNFHWVCSAQNTTPPPNPKVTQRVTTLLDANLITKQVFAYDQYNNPTDIWEYGFGVGAPGPLLRHTHTEYLTVNQFQGNVNYATDLNIHIRNLPTYISVSDGNGAEISKTWFDYDAYGINGLPALQDCPGISQHDGGFHTGYGARGNLVKITRIATSAPTYVHQHFFYDIAGNVVQKLDGRGIPTMIDFSDRFGAPGNDPRTNAGAPELAGSFSYAFPTKVTDALDHTAYTQYDFYIGKAVTKEDANGVISSVAYNDALDRPTQSIQARYVVGVGVPSVRRQTTTAYDDVNRVITTTSDREAFSDNILTSKSYYNGLGWKRRSAVYEGSTWSITDTRFDAFGRVSQVSNPYRAADPSSASPPSGLWTTTDYDALGRVIKVTTPDAATVNTEYNGNRTLVIDQAGKIRISQADALGRLTSLWEVRSPDAASGTVSVSFPNHPEITAGYQTNYLYDPLGNLRKVTQGAQSRWFSYDSLSRLVRAKNPEQNCNGNLPPHTDPFTGGSCWSTAYSYDPNDNLIEKTDARNIKTTYGYDALNRNTTTGYSDSTPGVTRTYDTATLGKGRLQKTETAGSMGSRVTINDYDAMGRPLVKWQYFWRGSDWGTPFVIQQSYDLAGAVKTVTYPSGRVVNYSYNQSGRLNSFIGNLGDGVNRNYATDIQYDAAGLMKREQFGATIPLYHRRHYSNRGQLFDIRLGTDPNPVYDSDDLGAWQNAAGSWNRGALRFYYSTLNGCHLYGSGGTDNNGNLLRMDHHIPLDGAVSNFVASIDRYDYDPLNRLKSVTELSHTLGPSGEDVYQGVFRQALLYDRWGNRTIDQINTVGGVNEKAYTVDTATNRLTSVDGVTIHYDAAGNQTNDGSGERIYDGENRLVEAKNGAGVTLSRYIYDPDGRRVRRIIGGQETWQVYGTGGELSAEYAAGAASNSPQKEYGYRNEQLLVVWDGSETGDRRLQWLVQDHLGSTRMVVDRSGSLAGVRRHDFAPFGEELFAGVGIRSASNGYSGDLVRQKFGSKERDSETLLDFFISRYYSSIQGRYTSPDYFSGNPAALMNSLERSSALPYATLSNPQTLNLYSYVENNPLSLTDPDGHSGKREKLGRYTVRIDRNNINDAPNIHVFDGKKEIGRVAFKESGPEFTGDIAKEKFAGLRRQLVEFAESKGIRPRTPNFTGGAGGAGGAGPRGGRAGGAANVIVALTILQLVLDGVEMELDKRQLGYHFNIFGGLVIDDLNKAVNNLPRGTTFDVDIEGIHYHFILIGGHFITVNPNCEGCVLDQDEDGSFRLKGKRTCCD